MQTNTIPVSVIIPSYNSENHLKECIESINSGQWPIEILIIDDCSVDNSLNLAYKLRSHYNNIKVLRSNENSGAASARKLGIAAASQDLIALVDADDLLEHDALADAYTVMTSSCADICIWDLWRFDVNKNWRVDTMNLGIFPKTGREATLLTLGGWGIHPLGIARKKLYEKAYHGFCETAFNADELLTRLVFSHAKIVIACKKKYFYRKHADSTTQTLNVRRLGSLNSCLWLLDFARNYPEAPIQKMIYTSIAEAWYCWKHREQIGNVETLNALKIFVPKIYFFPGVKTWLWRSPKHFIALLFLYMTIFASNIKAHRALHL